MNRLLTLFAIAIPLLFLTPLPLADASSHTLIEPGGRLTTSTGGCTLNFVYDGSGPLAGKVYMGTAAHCVSHIGQAASTPWTSSFGTVAFIRNAGTSHGDYAFIEVHSQFHGRVSPAVKGHPDWPTGHTVASETSIGDLIGISGHGTGFGTTPYTAHHRYGALERDTATTYHMQGPVIFGDSGGPLVHVDTGKALGIVSRLTVSCCTGTPVDNNGPTVDHILRDAEAQGFPVTLRTI